MSLAALLAIVSVGLALRAHHLGEQPLWLDEGFTFFSATLPWDVLWSTPTGAHPPIYYSLVKLATAFGQSETIIRAFSVAVGTATIPVVYVIGRKCGGTSCGLAAAAAVALSGIHVEYSQEARSYALVSFLLSLAVLAAVSIMGRDSAQQGGNWRWLCLYAASAALSVFTHVAAIYVVFGLAVAVIAYRVALDPDFPPWRAVRLAWGFIAINLAVAVAWLGVVMWMAQTARNFSSYAHFDFRVLFGFLTDIAGDRFLSSLGPVPGFVVLVSCLIGAYLLARRRAFAAFSLVVVLVFVVPVLIWLTGFFRPILMDRTILPSLLGIVLCVGALAMAPRRPAAIALLAGYFAVASLNVAAYHRDFRKQDWRGAAAFMDAEKSANAAVVLCLAGAYWSLRYYTKDVPGAIFSVIPKSPGMLFRFDEAKLRGALTRSMSGGAPVSLLEASDMQDSPWLETMDQNAALRSFGEVWVVESHCAYHGRDTALAVFHDRLRSAGFAATAGQHFGKMPQAHHLRVTRYERLVGR